MSAKTLYDFSATSIQGKPADFGAQRGKVFLIVNTASKCGFTPQFAGLEALWSQYRERGLVVIGFPSNEFGGQDPGSDSEIASFCQTTYDVSFPMMSKVRVNGASTYQKSADGSGETGSLRDVATVPADCVAIARDATGGDGFCDGLPPADKQACALKVAAVATSCAAAFPGASSFAFDVDFSTTTAASTNSAASSSKKLPLQITPTYVLNASVRPVPCPVTSRACHVPHRITSRTASRPAPRHVPRHRAHGCPALLDGRRARP